MAQVPYPHVLAPWEIDIDGARAYNTGDPIPVPAATALGLLDPPEPRPIIPPYTGVDDDDVVFTNGELRSIIEALVSEIAAGGVPDATTTIKGKLQLAGDLAGTAGVPVVAPGKITDAKVAPSAAITQSKIAGLVADLAAKAADSVVAHKAGDETFTGVKTHITAPRVNESGSVRVTRETRTPRQFGAPMNGTGDDTAGLRAALDAMGDVNSMRPAELVIDGPLVLSDTVIIYRKSGHITAPGWGSSFGANSNAKSYIKWIGPAGIEMIRVHNCWGLKMSNLRFAGSSTAKPSAAIRFVMVDANSNTYIELDHIWVGPLWGYDTDHARQFTNGMLWDGVNLNNDLMLLSDIHLHQCDTGLKFAGTMMGEHELLSIHPTYCGVGIDTQANIGITGLHCLGNDGYDMKISNDARLLVSHYSSEGSAAMADLTSYPSRLSVRGGGFQAGANLRSDGRFINGQTPYVTQVNLEDFTLAPTGGWSGSDPRIRLEGGAAKMLVLRRTNGILPAHIEMAAASGGEKRVLIVEQSPGWSASMDYGIVHNVYDQGNFDLARFDVAEQTIAQRRAASAAIIESWRQSTGTNQEVGRWDFLSASTRQLIAQMRAITGSDFADSGELAFLTKYSGSPAAERLRLLGAGGLLIKNTTVNPSTAPTAGAILYTDKDDGHLKVLRADGVVKDLTP